MPMPLLSAKQPKAPSDADAFAAVAVTTVAVRAAHRSHPRASEYPPGPG